MADRELEELRARQNGMPPNFHGWRMICTCCGCAPKDKSCKFNCVCHAAPGADAAGQKVSDEKSDCRLESCIGADAEVRERDSTPDATCPRCGWYTKDSGECQRLREALRKIADPIASMRSDAEAQGAKLNGMMAVQLAADANYLKGIAAEALKESQ